MLSTGIVLFTIGLLIAGILGAAGITNFLNITAGDDVEAGFKRHLRIMIGMIPAGICTVIGLVLIIVSLFRG